jgi:hypothetical protein
MLLSVITRWPLRTGCGNLMWMRFSADLRRLDLFHPLDLLELALRLRRLARLGAEPVGELLQLRDFRLLVFVGREMLLLPRRPLLDIGVVIAAIAMDLLVADLEIESTSALRKARSCEIIRIAPG